ncbi:MAG: hypothetical protein ACK5OX_17885 [Desertimonas sp.]
MTATGPDFGAHNGGGGGGANRPVTTRRDGLAGQPEGLTQRLVLNALEAFFRRPLVHLIPFFLLVGLGLFTALGASSQYRSVGVLDVTSGDLLTDISQAETPIIGFDPPATTSANGLNNLIATGSFMLSVVEIARLTPTVEQGLLTLDDIRGMITVEPNGDSLVAVWATTDDAELSQRLAAATITAYREYNVTGDLGDADITIRVLERRLEQTNVRYETALERRAQYVADNPEPPAPAERSSDEQAELGVLGEELTRARTALSEAEIALDDAEIARDEARAISERELRVVDSPMLPTSPEPRLKESVLTTAMFAVMGLILSIGFVVFAATIDRSVRMPADVTSRFPVDVLAVIPQVRR